MRLSKLSSKPRRKTTVAAPPAASGPQPQTVWQFEAIGTQWWIALYDGMPEAGLTALYTAVQGRIARFDKTYSRFRDDSLVTTMSRQAGSYAIPARGRDMLRLYRQLYEVSNGAVTPLVGLLLEDAGYDAAYSLQSKPLRPVPAWDDVMSYDDGVLTLRRPALLDFGALGKGCLVDMVSRLLQGAGLSAFCVDAGGDMVYVHPQLALRVGLEHPDDTSQAIGIARLGGPQPAFRALCGSAGNRRAWGDWQHIVDPHTARSPKHVKAVWVAADSALLADAMTTALYFVEPELLRKHFDFAWLIVDPEGRASQSPDFPASLFTADDPVKT